MDWLAGAWRRGFATVPDWRLLSALCERNVGAHGDARTWLAAIDRLPEIETADVDVGATIRIGTPNDLNEAQSTCVRDALLALRPWRKGPFSLFGIHVDTEWRSDWKWSRIAPHVELSGKRVLDVGCGNGYYGWRMCESGAHSVVGLDPTIVYAMQYVAVGRYLTVARPTFVHALLPIRLEDAPCGGRFDTVFSMGVLYHRRDPLDHLTRLRAQLATGGELVLETLILADDRTEVLVPGERYARMRNVWQIPGRARLEAWLREARFIDARIVDVTATTVDEQRATPWTTGESLADGLDPNDSSRTIEGYPAPVRAIAIARA